MKFSFKLLKQRQFFQNIVYIIFLIVKHFCNIMIVSVAIVMGDTADEVYSNVKDVVRDQSGPVVWIPSGDLL